MRAMVKNKAAALAVLCGLLLVWSYFARPVYDFIRIGVGRLWDREV
jgi:hypothetical protein